MTTTHDPEANFCTCPPCEENWAAYVEELNAEGPTCSMCDGLHGGSFCPLEDTADYSGEPAWAI